ncbi:MAG: FKBP-type peptidyl-prolyl cis-trans isomerase [Prevotella sp.]|nr:FKBP-type peptidyl-prolyl cis-trans isomerase [Prevotella sp.]
MDKLQHRFLSVVYQLYVVADGESTLQEQTSTDRPFEFISGFGIALENFEQQVVKLERGSTFDFILPPAEAFGEYDPEGVHKLEREAFCINGHFDRENIYIGAVITLVNDEDQQFMAKVVKIEEDGVTIDTNHPLAGKTLNFTGLVRENREATEEEVQHLIKHLAGGCCCGGNCEGHDHQHDGGCGCGHCHH